MTPLPMTVISGYLGAGKTTLINKLLSEDHGLKLLILVNDFGAINIDVHNLASAREDTIELTNGCVCCTMGADLFMALGDALDRRPRPDHLIVEASGVADPVQIARAAIAEPEMAYAGIVTVVDGPAIADLCNDPLIGAQVVQQITHADLIWVSKLPSGGQLPDFADITNAPLLKGDEPSALLSLLGLVPPELQWTLDATPHPDYVAWSFEGRSGLTVEALRFTLESRPKGLFRLKGSVSTLDGGLWDVQIVGNRVELCPAKGSAPSALIGIGLAASVTPSEIEHWWATRRS